MRCFQVNWKIEWLGNSAVGWNEKRQVKKNQLQSNKKYSCSFQIGNGIKDNFVVISNVKWEANEKENQLIEPAKKKTADKETNENKRVIRQHMRRERAREEERKR